MSAPDYLIQNCIAADFEFTCPKKWSELKPSLMAAVRDCHHCNRKVYLCTTDADLKLYSSLSYCMAVIKPQTQAEKQWEARSNPQQRPMRRVGNKFVEDEVLMGIPSRDAWLGNARPALGLRTVPRDLDAYEVPSYLRMPLPDKDKLK